MPKGPNGEKRPADAVGLAVLIGRIASGEVEDAPEDDGKDGSQLPKTVRQPSRAPRRKQKIPS